MRTTYRGVLIILAVAAITASALVASAGAATSPSKPPPCTKQALAAGLKRGPAKLPKAKFAKPFACAGSWAFSAVLVGTGKQEIEATAVYQVVKGQWQSVDRAKPCAKHLIPKKIYRPACLTN